MNFDLRLPRATDDTPLPPEVSEFLKDLFFEAGVYTEYSELKTAGDARAILKMMVDEIGALNCRSESDIWFGSLIDHPAKPGSTYANGHFYNLDNGLGIRSWDAFKQYTDGWNLLPMEECVEKHMQYVTDHLEMDWRDKLVNRDDINSFYIALAKFSRNNDMEMYSTIGKENGNWTFFT